MEHKTLLLVEDNPDDEALTLRALRKHNLANEIVVARIGDDVTVKRYQRHGASVSLIAENDDYLPIEVDLQTETFAIEGVVVGLIRQGF